MHVPEGDSFAIKTSCSEDAQERINFFWYVAVAKGRNI